MSLICTPVLNCNFQVTVSKETIFLWPLKQTLCSVAYCTCPKYTVAICADLREPGYEAIYAV